MGYLLTSPVDGPEISAGYGNDVVDALNDLQNKAPASNFSWLTNLKGSLQEF